MKNKFKFAASLFFIVLTSNIFAAVVPDAILGNWEDRDPEHGISIINIYKDSSKYYGKLIKIQDTAQLDVENPDKSLRKNKVQGLIILKNLKFDGQKEWNGGSIYDPKTGKTYSCKVWLENSDVLKMRGFIGFSLLGETHEWYREKNDVK